MIVKKWRVLSQEYLYKKQFLTIRKDAVELPNKTIIKDYHVIENRDWVNVIAVTDDNLFVFEKQYRHGIKRIGYELCAGYIEDNETALVAAQRELLEETGYSGGQWEKFMTSYPDPSSMNIINHTFLAKGVKKLNLQKLEDTEQIEIRLFTLHQVVSLLNKGLIYEGCMQAPLWKYISVLH